MRISKSSDRIKCVECCLLIFSPAQEITNFVGRDDLFRLKACDLATKFATDRPCTACYKDLDGAGGEEDPLYDKALAFVTETRRASISSVQRHLRVGYNRAARMIESMEAAGAVGPLENGKREVIAPATSD